MNNKDILRLSNIFTKIGERLKSDPGFIDRLEKTVTSDEKDSELTTIDFEKINSLDLFQLIRDKSQNEVDEMLSSFTLKELRGILKKYRFGSSSKLKTTEQLRKFIINQLVQRKTDVFQNSTVGQKENETGAAIGDNIETQNDTNSNTTKEIA